MNLRPKLLLTPDFSHVEVAPARTKTVFNGFSPIPLNHTPTRRTNAFSLLELLVVITIIALLASFLLPAFQRAKVLTLSTSCLNNLKQLQLSYISYAHDNNDRLIFNEMTDQNLIQRSIQGWVLGNAQFDTNTDNIRAGVIFPYVKSVELYRCPADKSMVRHQPGTRRTRSYAVLGWLNSAGAMQGLDNPPETLRFMKAKLSDVGSISPSRCFCFIEEHEMSIDDGVFGMGGGLKPALGMSDKDAGANDWGELPSDRHNQGCNLSFLDGHVEHWRWLAPKIFKTYMQRATKDDLKDLRRLQDALPYD